ncbi:MAG: DUF1552 domain-containing protein [Sandaracinaceae bacterium]|nr:DUF1552 domain-containing protein [Sandaracinaceae bacterium]
MDKKLGRRIVLRGAGGAMLALPLLESVGRPQAARANDETSYAVFFRQANGVAAAQNTSELGSEPERFWPRDPGPLTTDGMRDRSIDELTDFRSQLLVLGNVNTQNFDYGDGHARGALQCLTARGPTVDGQGGSSEAAGQSIDHYLGRALNPGGRDSWFMYAGRTGGWLGGPCISYRGPADRRSPIHDPREGYMTLVGGDAGLSAEAQRQLAERGRSVNDLVRSQLVRLMSTPRLSRADRDRIELHRAAVRDIEIRLACQLPEDTVRQIDGLGTAYNSTDGDEVLATARLHMDVAALAIACGVTRSVAIQVGNGNDGNTRYRNLSTGAQLENFHYLSHRRLSHDSSGAIISDSDQLHAMVDRQFARTFRHLLSRLAEYPMPTGGTLLDCGVSAWLNDLGNGPAHSRQNLPWILAGSAGGRLRQGEYLRLSGNDRNALNHGQLLNTIATALGVPTSDFGDPGLPRGTLNEMMR